MNTTARIRLSFLSPMFLLLSAISFSLLPGNKATAQTTSTWSNTPNSNDWFDPLNWNAGIPNAPGDIARIGGSTRSTVEPTLTAPVTLGQLDFLGAGPVTVAGPNVLTFDNPGDAPAAVQTVLPRNFGVDATIAAPIAIATGEQLLLNIEVANSLTLSGGIVSTGGDITKTGPGPLTLAGASPNWSGSLNIEEGDLVLEYVDALASSRDLLIGPNGTLTFVSQEDTGQVMNYSVPSLSLDGGTIQTNLGFPRRTTGVTTNIHLLGDSTIQLPTEDELIIEGTVDGSGGLSIEMIVDPDVFPGNSSRTLLSIRGATSYSGETYIGPNIRAAFEHAEALGDTSAGTRVFRGTLELHQGGGREKIEVEQGRVHLVEASTPYGHEITLIKGNISGGVDGRLPATATLSSGVRYSGDAVLGLSSGNGDLILGGGINGIGSVVVRNGVGIGGSSNIRGNVYIHEFRGVGKISGAIDIAGDVFVDGGLLTLSGDTRSPDSVFFIRPGLKSGQLVVSHDNTLKSVIIDPRDTTRTIFDNAEGITVRDGAILTITEEIQFLGGGLRGAIAGQKVLTKKGRTRSSLSDIAGSDFEKVMVEGGALHLSGNMGDSPPEIHLGSHDTALVRLRRIDNFNYPGDIYLNNAIGDGEIGALHLQDNVNLTGNLYLGDQGSVISANSTHTVGISGTIHGGSLTVLGRGGTAIHSGGHTYTGPTNVFGELRLVLQGALNSTSKIVGAGQLAGSNNQGELILDNGTVAHGDRIPDGTPIHLNGMKLTLVGRDGEHVTETLGTFHLTRGLSEVFVSNPSSENSQTTLLVHSLDRQAGGAIRFDTADFNDRGVNVRIRLVEAPSLDDNLIGGWALVRARNTDSGQDFATYGPDGIVAYQDIHTYATDLAGAGPSDNVFLDSQNSITLSNNQNVNALKLFDSEVDLNGHRLTIESGGLLISGSSSTIKGGQLTSGGAELIVSGFGNIEAGIVDNSQGAVGLTFSGSDLRLSGNNTYTGATILNWGGGGATDVKLLSETALPEGGDVTLNGAHLYVAYDSVTPILLGHLEMRDGTHIRGTSSNPPAINPKSLFVESGRITDLQVIGNAPITKTGLNGAFFGESLANHTGPISIERGLFQIGSLGPAPLDDQHAVTVHKGGRLRATSDYVITGRKLRLDGGVVVLERRGGVSSPIEVLTGGGFIRNERDESVISSAITGHGLLTIEGGFGGAMISFAADINAFEGDIRFTGNRVSISGDNSSYLGSIEVAAGLVAGGENVFGEAEVTVLPEGRLNAISPLQGDITLAGGAIDLSGTSGTGTQLSGKLLVSRDSYLFVPVAQETPVHATVSSQLEMLDQVDLAVVHAPGMAGAFALNILSGAAKERLTLSGDIRVNGDATITSFDVLVRLNGTITPATEVATLNLVGNDTFEFGAAIQLDGSKSLSVTFDGEAAPLTLAGSGNDLRGDGTIGNSVLLTDGAAVSPGNSAGLLTIDGDATLGAGSLFIVELGGTIRGEQYDALDVTGDVTLGGVLNVSFLDDFIPSPEDGFVILQAAHIEGMFSNATESITVGGVELPVTYLPSMVVLGNATVVPEPGTIALLLLGFTALAAQRIRSRTVA